MNIDKRIVLKTTDLYRATWITEYRYEALEALTLTPIYINLIVL